VLIVQKYVTAPNHRVNGIGILPMVGVFDGICLDPLGSGMCGKLLGNQCRIG
jgi:hypothetical protein